MTEVDIAPDIGVSLQLVVATAAILGNIALHTIATVAVIAGLRRFEPTMSKLLGDAFIAVPMMVAAATLGMLVAHTIEIWGWAVMLLWLGEFSNLESALYFSVVTFSTLGYGDIVLDHQWRLLGAMASVNGIILFGWTTAVVVAVLTSAIERHDERRSARKAREGQPEGHHAWQPWHPHAPWRPHIQDVRHRADHISDHNAGAGD
ncbi:MAG: hypothetical protein CMO30_12310 [Tistrella sp.]|jgi:hypothetical protein|uniref:Two pore domain potassium channel family protein n=1 Tax=Tistrella mobilis TaxID=171437 RepID=A0A161QZG4_9PROT|nr:MULTISPECIES: potassium channel family protein [Tistrella]KYO50229.1 hypothetical protein AUP44_13895 [Tistrella mobilis]MAD37506.1 hypothetical protein [Tistrella sp.]MBA76050.1 hypothetical protein [Tistrella sp.]HAE46415.1 two pore domain potassium channel family protein [Tistrella mobilis]